MTDNEKRKALKAWYRQLVGTVWGEIAVEDALSIDEQIEWANQLIRDGILFPAEGEINGRKDLK